MRYSLLLATSLSIFISCTNVENTTFNPINMDYTDYAGKRFYKEGMQIDNVMEGSLFSFKNNDYLLISEREEAHGKSIFIKQIIYNSNRQITGFIDIKSLDVNIGLVSILVNDNEAQVYGTTDWSITNKSNCIFKIASIDLLNWSSPILVYKAPENTLIFNTSICRNSSKYYLAYEIREPNTVPFSVRFLTSDDANSWIEHGTIFKPNEYAACPCIKFENNKFYIIWLNYQDGYFSERISRTKNFLCFDDSAIYVLDPRVMENDINMSDIDLMETGGRILINYAVGNQSSSNDAYASIKFLSVESNLTTFLGSYF